MRVARLALGGTFAAASRPRPRRPGAALPALLGGILLALVLAWVLP